MISSDARLKKLHELDSVASKKAGELAGILLYIDTDLGNMIFQATDPTDRHAWNLLPHT